MEHKPTFSSENFDKLITMNTELSAALKGIINSCAHPEIAIRCVMVDLKPIRKVIKKNDEVFGA